MYSLVVIDAALHLCVGLDTSYEIARGAEQRLAQVLHRFQEGLRHGGLHQALSQFKARQGKASRVESS